MTPSPASSPHRAREASLATSLALDSSPLNHWPQPISREWGAARKDALEQRICGEICLTGDDRELARYQEAFAKDWVALYRQIMR